MTNQKTNLWKSTLIVGVLLLVGCEPPQVLPPLHADIKAAHPDLVLSDQLEMRRENGLNLWYEINSDIPFNGVELTFMYAGERPRWIIQPYKDGKSEEQWWYNINGFLIIHAYKDDQLGKVSEYFRENGSRESIAYGEPWEKGTKPTKWFDLEGKQISESEFLKLECSKNGQQSYAFLQDQKYNCSD
jgi:hypothetical protein